MVKMYEEATTMVVGDVLCDCCGNSCKVNSTPPLICEYATFQAYWGYFSKKDGTQWDCDLCETCADKVKQFIESIGGGIGTHEG